jgi:hypothetical protein
MNENIRRIAEQTNFTIAESPIWRLKVEEFAQAIVKECANIAHTAEPYQSSDNILKHFGLE